MEYRLRRFDGTYRAFLARAIPVRDQNGRIERWIGSSTDIHDQKSAEEALRRSEKLAVTGRLASSIAHEINNPLMAVTSLVYLIEQDAALSDSTRKNARAVQSELARVTHIVTQTLRFSRSSKRAADTDLREIIDSVLSLFQARLDASNISVQLDYGIEAAFNGYPDDLRQVVANLIGNAHEAMRDGGKLRIRVREAKAWDDSNVHGIRLTMADNGIGIDSNFKKHIFEPFTTTNKETGTGLGLWVTNEIVQQHNGRISVRSSTKLSRRGTTFSLFLPFDGAHNREVANVGKTRKNAGVPPFPFPQRLANYH
jgi:signal transduction histidine kinase